MSATTDTHESEVAILARVFVNEKGKLPSALARYFLTLTFSERDKARLHDLAVRNQADALSPAEKDELLAFGKVGDLLAILKSKARQTLGGKPRRPPSA